jgi:uncharacterized lipoprotein YddW (UPF0748 family)
MFLSHKHQHPEEIRGVWLTNTDSTVLHSRPALEEGIQHLQSLGFNTLYPVVWQRGFTLYPSAVAEAWTGSSVMPVAHFQQRDMLAEVVAAARKHQLRVIPWFEYGLMAPKQSELARRQIACLALDKHQNSIRRKRHDGDRLDDNVWLNPCLPSVRDFFAALLAEIVEQYDIDGIQFDDRFGFPIELGYGPATRQRYRQECRLRAVLPYQQAKWTQWTTDQLTLLLESTVRSVKAKRPDCTISLAPNPYDFSRTYYRADWQTWVAEGWIDELVLQVYRGSVAQVARELSQPAIVAARVRIPVAIGLLAGLKAKPMPLPLIRKQLQEIRRHQFSGVAFFFYETVLQERLPPQAIPRDDVELSRLWK